MAEGLGSKICISFSTLLPFSLSPHMLVVTLIRGRLPRHCPNSRQ